MATTWNDLKETLLTPDERTEIDLKVRLISAIQSARKSKGLTQKQLEAISGVKQPLIARIESGKVDPQMTTILKMLKPLGLTLNVVDDNQL